MSKDSPVTPPKWPLRFLRFFVKKDYLEEIEGDMEEMFRDSLETNSIRKAERIYAWEMLKLLRPLLLNNLEGTIKLNSYGMFRNYLKTSIRSLKRNALFTGINVVGLSISMSVGILMIVLLSELYSFDDFHAHKDNIYRVTSSLGSETSSTKFATSSIYIAKQIKQQVPGVEKVTTLRSGMFVDLKLDDKAIGLKGFFASSSFFEVFSFELIHGDPHTALSEPFSIVLTESKAQDFFEGENPVGKLVTLVREGKKMSGKVTGVVKDPPLNSHLQFKSLLSMKTLEMEIEDSPDNFMNNREMIWNSKVYVLLKDGVKKEDVASAIGRINETDNLKGRIITNQLQGLTDIVPSEQYNNQMGPQFSESKVYMMIGLTLIVLFSACFNYTNLSLARALRRAKEVAIRKVTGASRIQIFSQFSVEAVLLAFIALIGALGFFYIIRPGFLNLPMESGFTMYNLQLNYHLIPYFVVFVLCIGLLAGLAPSIFLSKLKSNLVSKDASQVKLSSNFNIRQLLVLTQFVLSIGLIMFSTVAYKQYKFTVNYDLGYNTENIINLRVNGDYLDVLEHEYAKVPEVVETSRSNIVLGIKWSYSDQVISDDKMDTVSFGCSNIDEKYLRMHGFEMLAGSGFHSKLNKNEEPNKIIINEKLVNALNLGSKDEAIGKYIWFGKNRLAIVGVVNEFVNSSLHSGIEPFAFLQTKQNKVNQTLSIKIIGNDVIRTMEKLETIYKEVEPTREFDAEFYDEKVEASYEEYMVTYTIISFLAFLAISISTLGLLGMAVFTTETRMKEISIRKVLGASVQNLMLLLSKSFLILVVLAGMIAIPATLYLVDDLVLSEFAYHIDIGWVETLSGFAIVFLIGILTIGWQIRQAVVQNPADLLRDE
jgi:putative ABC transport system permease protein